VFGHTLLVITGLVPAIQDFGDADLFRMREKSWGWRRAESG
jgi:hypothetical protein